MGDSESDSDKYDELEVPEQKLFFNQPDQEVGASQRTKAQSESEIEIETDPSEVTGTIFKGCGKNDDKIKLLSEAYHLAYGGLIRRSHDLKDYFSVKTPILENTVLHIAAWYGNDDVVDLVAKDAPNLLFSFNKNGDTPLHVAARAGNIPTVKKLLATYANCQRREIVEEWIKYKKQGLSMVQDYDEGTNMGDLLELVKKKNVVQGNTMLHEAMVVVSGKKKGMNIGANFFQAFESYKTKDWELEESLSESCYKYALDIANHAKKSALYLAVEAGDHEAVKLILDKCPQKARPRETLSPLVAAIMKRDEGMLKMILSKKPKWIHLIDKNERLALHYAASTGYREGVVELLDKCKCCSIQKDKYGYFPLHLASHGGHLRVVAELLKYCPDPTEMLDSYKRNILHIATKSGKLVVVRYILQSTNKRHEMIINQKDSRGDTPLHLAIRSCHFETVERLIRDSRVDLGMVNQTKETALDIASALYQVNKSSLGQNRIDMAGDLNMINKWAEIKQFSKQLDQAIVARTRAQSENNNEIGADFSESILSHMIQCGTANDNFSTLRAQWIWFSEQYCRCASPRERDDYFSMKTPMGNTVLHMAAWYGMDDVVDAVAKNAPNLLFSFNSNEDTPLHIAARAGSIRTVEKLLATYANFKEHGIAEEWIKYNNREDLSVEDYSEEINIEDLKELVRKKNKAEGNTMFHEAMLCGKLFNVLLAFEPYKTKGRAAGSLSESCYEYTLIANHARQSVLYLAVEAGDQNVVQLILDKCHHYGEMMGTLSPILAAIMHRDAGMLCIMLDKKPHWIHLMDKNGRLPLHYAASTGYLEGVIVLLDRCKCCSNRRDEYGYVPLHLASNGGHVEVVKELLKHCPNPTEMLADSYERNILHIAAKSGKNEVVRYILQTATKHHYEMMINQMDSRGDTPLHLATRSCHPKTVHCLTWDPRVDLGAINQNKETALDIANALYQHNNQNASMRLQLVWIALKSAGVKQSSSTVLPIESRLSYSKPDEKTPEMKLINDKVGNKDSDRVETLSIVSTLIITASVAACLGVPGEAEGRANNLYHAMFQVFIICITISLFSSISATIILFWARLGLIELLAYSLKIIMPLLGVALISLSLAFLAGIYTVISQLSWLATLFLVMAGIFVVVEFSLYILLFLPSSSTNKLLRYISYYPFLFLASLAESRSNQGTGFNRQGFLERASRN